MYREGNLGYAYTLRNVKMQDGSYATVTVSGFNYYNYGFRVWIKPSIGNDVKIHKFQFWPSYSQGTAYFLLQKEERSLSSLHY